MKELKGSRTHANLKAAFAQESQSNRRYLYFARQADLDGYPEIAGLFRDTAEGEAGHAQGMLDYLKPSGDPASGLPIGTSELNLRAAVAGESAEYSRVYPAMAETARLEGFPDIAAWFQKLAQAENHHAERFEHGLEQLRELDQ